MTDKEIIQALECCGKNRIAGSIDACEHCFLQNSAMCVTELIYKTLDLINRLQAENEHYSHNVKEMTDSIRNYQKALEQAKAEIERLNKQLVFEIESAYDRGFKTAIKEFAERLKAKEAIHFCKCGETFVYTDLFNGELDNLVKEMVGK